MLKALAAGQIGFWKVLCCSLLSFSMCAPESGPWLSPSSHWWYILLSLSVLYKSLGWYFWSRKLWLRRNRFMGERPGKFQTDTSLLQPSGSVGEKTGPTKISSEFAPAPGFQSLPSLQAPHVGQHFNLSISLPPSSSPVYSPFPFPCLIFSFFLIAPLSHTHIPWCIIFLLEPVLMASFQEQQVWISSSLKWRQGVGVERGQERISAHSCPMYRVHSPPPSLQAGAHAPNLPSHPPSLSLCPDTSPHTGMYKKKPNNPWQARPETPTLNQAAGFH